MRTLLDVMLDMIYTVHIAAKCGDTEQVNAIIEGLTDIRIACPDAVCGLDDVIVQEETDD